MAVFNLLPFAGEWSIRVLPAIEIGKLPAAMGYKRVIWLTFSWLFWQIQFSRE